MDDLLDILAWLGVILSLSALFALAFTMLLWYPLPGLVLIAFAGAAFGYYRLAPKRRQR